MELQYGISAYQRDRGDLPELPVINMLVEKTPTDRSEIVLQSRPGLEENSAAGSGEVRGIFKKDGVFSSDIFTVTDLTAYRAGVSLGAIVGAGEVSFAATGDDDDYDDQIVIATGGTSYFYNGTLAAIVFPDSANVIKVAYLSGYFIYLKENSQRFYWSTVNNGSLIDGLDFASAENEPDALLDIIVLNDMLVLIGTETTEFWQITGDSDLPFAPITGRVFNKGCKSTGAATTLDNTGGWVSGDNIVYYIGEGGTPLRVSDNGIEERIGKSATVRVFTFFWEGHEFLAIRLAQGTWLWDISTRQWCEFESYGKDNWLPGCAASGPIFGSSENGQILQFGNSHSDLGGVLERRFRAGFPLNGGAIPVNNVRGRFNSGQTPILNGQYSDPLAEIRVSNDAGQTFRNYKSAKMGKQGKYRQRTEWRALGMADEPGFLCEIRCTDPIPFRVSGVAMNEVGGGRSR